MKFISKTIIKNFLLGIIIWYVFNLGNFWQFNYTFLADVIGYCVIGLFCNYKKYTFSETLFFVIPNILGYFSLYMFYNQGCEYPVLFPICPIFSVFSISLGYYWDRIWYYNNTLFMISLIIYGGITTYMFKEGVPFLMYNVYAKTVNIAQPNLALWDVKNDKLIHFTTQNDKIIFLETWHTQCGACINLFPYLDAIHKHFQTDTNVVIGSLATQKWDSLAKIQNFKYLKNTQFNQYYDESGHYTDFLEKMEIYGAPVCILIKNGRIVYLHRGFGKIEKPIIVEALISEIKKNRYLK